MRALCRVVLASSVLLVGTTSVANAGQAPPKPPVNDDCLACHGDPDVKRTNGTPVALDAAVLAASTHGPLACVDCHADLAAVAEFPHPDALQKVACATCHDAIGATYQDSIHSRAREKSGLNVAPACANCHGSHDILGQTDPKSRVSRARVPATCGACHDGIETRFERSVHATVLRRGDPKGPVCSTCHTAHGIQRVDTDAAKLAATAECGSCHLKVATAFTRTFHGKVNQLGSASAAKCADCHNAHDIIPASNVASSVSPANLMTTCGKCHQGANANFVQYDPHPNPSDYDRGAALWWINRFYWVVIPGCFGFFALHSVLWFWRSRKDALAHKDEH